MTCKFLLLLFWTTFLRSCKSSGANEWTFTTPDDYVTAFINVTYIHPLTGQLHTEKSNVGKYASGKVSGASGLTVHIRTRDGTSHHGCEYPFENDIPTEPWIALIKRGRCSFDTKVENAHKSNATAVVVYDKQDAESLEKMGIKYRNMTAVFTYKWKGEEIASLVDNGTRVMVTLTVGNHFSRTYGNINRTSVLFVSISFVVLMIILLAWLVFYYIQRFRYLHAKDRLARRLCSAAKKAISKIPTHHVKSGDKVLHGDGECCAICIEPYRNGDFIRSLPCKHQFHKTCVDPWLLEHHTCPMCKMDILKYYGYEPFQYKGSQESILHVELGEDRVTSTDHRRGAGSRTESVNTPTSPPNPTLSEISMMVLLPCSSEGGRPSFPPVPDDNTPTQDALQLVHQAIVEDPSGECDRPSEDEDTPLQRQRSSQMTESDNTR